MIKFKFKYYLLVLITVTQLVSINIIAQTGNNSYVFNGESGFAMEIL